MRVLHLYSPEEPQIAQYVSMLMQALSGKVESLVTNNRAEAMLLLKSEKPDLLHLHGGIDISNLPYNIRRLNTPSGVISHLPHVPVYIARSNMEAQRLKNSFAKSKNVHIVVVRNAMITRTTTTNEMVENTFFIYQKLLDSNPWELMNETTRNMLAAVIKASICGDKCWILSHPSSQLVNFRQIYIYSDLENIADFVEHGIRILGIETPEKPHSYEIYLPDNYNSPKPFAGKGLSSMLHDIQSNGLTLLRMIEMAKVLFKEDINENLLVNKLKDENLSSLFSAILQLMKERFWWDEGYMPCTPVDNNDTQHLRTLLNQHTQL